MLAVASLVALLGQVAKVDIRGSGTPSEAILKQQLASTYATAGIPGAGQLLPVADITLNTAIPGSYILEVDSAQATADALTNFWCQHPDQKPLFETLIEMPMVGLEVTEIITCTGASGEGCTESTCGASNGGGDVDDDGTPDPAPDPEPAPDNGGGGGGDKKDDDGGGLSAVAIVFIVLGTLFVLGFLVYLLWPWLQSCWVPATTHAEPMIGPVTPTPSGVALPTLFNVA